VPGDRNKKKVVGYWLSAGTDCIVVELRGLAPIGMMEFWNIGIMGSGKMEWWVWRIKTNIIGLFFW